MGTRSTRSFYFGEVIHDAEPRYADNHEQESGHSAVIISPASYTFDVLLHDDIWPESSPVVECYRTTLGPVAGQYAERSHDLIDMGLSTTKLDRGYATPAPGSGQLHRPARLRGRQGRRVHSKSARVPM